MSTLSIEFDDQFFARIRDLAAARSLSISEMAQRLLDVRSALPPLSEQLGPLTRASTGVATPMSDTDIEQVLEDEITRKHGGR